MVTDNSEKNLLLALDIGTEYVKTLLARRDKKTGDLDIIGQGKAKQIAGNMNAGAIADIESTIAVCEKALAAAEKQAGVSAKKVVVGIAGELIKGKTSTVHYTRSSGNRPLSDQEMQLIIEKVQKKTGEDARALIALETGNDNVEVRLINSAIVSMTIDGLKVSNPIGFKGSELSIEIYTAFAPLVHISAIEKVCAELGLDLIAVAVEPFAICRACLGEEPDNDFSAIILDIGGGTTDVAVVANGGVEGTASFGIGASGAEKNLNIWLQGISIALEDFIHPEDVLPGRIILCGGGASEDSLQEALALKNWFKGLPFARRPIIELADFDSLTGFTNSTASPLDTTMLTALGLLRVASDTESGAPASNTLRDKLSRLLQN